MNATQLSLLETEPRTLCGYCLRPLVLQPAGDWACDHCRSALAQIRTVEEFAAFQRRVHS